MYIILTSTNISAALYP